MFIQLTSVSHQSIIERKLMVWIYLLIHSLGVIYGWSHRPPLILDCEAPCWYGIRPGQSDVVDVIRSMPFILDRENVSDFWVRKSPVKSELFVSWYEVSVYNISHTIYIEENLIVDSISFPLTQFMSLDDVIQENGTPVFFLSSYFPGINGIALEIYYYFPNSVVAQHSRFISYDEEVFICPFDTIGFLTYYPSDLIQVNLLAESLGLDTIKGEKALDFLKFTGQYGWSGWGTKLDVPSEHGMYIQVIEQDISHCNFN